MSQQRFGILTRTVVQSSSVKQLLNARIRSWNENDLIFIGEDFIHVKHVGHNGHLEHVATKTDFDGGIKVAAVFDFGSNPRLDPFPLKIEKDTDNNDETETPPQILVLSLDSNVLMFIFMKRSINGDLEFIQQMFPLLSFDSTLFQPGEYLAVDPKSRAMAVAACQREVMLFSAKPSDQLRYEINTGEEDWCPVSGQRPLQVSGIIQSISFLFPPSEDPDHIILLIIVVDQRKTKALYVDWSAAAGLQSARVHPPQPLELTQNVPNLLIPLRNAAFMTIDSNGYKLWKNLLSGSVTGLASSLSDVEPMYPGNSPQTPLWASWCRPTRIATSTANDDHLYLVREDGLVYLMQVSEDNTVMLSLAGDFECHAGPAFASLGDDTSPDILALAGEMSSGRINSIGHWPRGRVNELSWSDTMEMDVIENIPNWATVTDMTITTLSQSHSRPTRSRDGVFVTSGRQPFGAITEIRNGLEARLALYFELEDLETVTDAWTLPLISSDSVLLLLTSPTSTWFVDFPVDVEEIRGLSSEDITALDTSHRTLAAGTTSDGRIIQVTENSICITATLMSNFEDSIKRTVDTGSSIIAASIHLNLSVVIAAHRTEEGSRIQATRFPSETASMNGEVLEWSKLSLSSEPSAIAFLPAQGPSLLAVIASTDSSLRFITLNPDGIVQEIHIISLPDLDDAKGICDHIVSLEAKDEHKFLILCGLRDGRVHSLSMTFDGEQTLITDNAHIIQFGNSSVRLTSLPYSPDIICAMCGPDTCAIKWNGKSASSLSIENIWISDMARPELNQGAILACTQMPPANSFASNEISGCMVMVSNEEFLVAKLASTPGPVPRQIPVTGTPNRILHAEQQRCLVCSSLRTEVLSISSSLPKPGGKRQIFPVIDFIPSRGSAPSFTYEMQPGERVYALMNWSFRSNEDKTYSFIMVGGSYTKSSGTVKGRVTFLQPTISRNWDVVDVKEGKSTTFDSPIYGLALYDDLTYVACSGQQVFLYRFNNDRKWEQACEPLKIASPGVSITVQQPQIYISTLKDSLITLRLTQTPAGSKLAFVNAAPQAAASLSHTTLPLPSTDTEHLTLLSTKYGQVTGFSSPPASTQHTKATTMHFEAQLPRSLTRLRPGNISPRWRPAPDSGVLVHNILGSAPDGALVGIAVLDEQLWRRLSWLQRLVEWSSVLSPRSGRYPPYLPGDDEVLARQKRALPIGFAGDGSEVELRTGVQRAGDMHVDGDVLVRALKPNGREVLRRELEELAGGDDAVGEWVKKRLEVEMEGLDEVLGILPEILNCWL